MSEHPSVLPLDKIHTREGFNPRTDVEVDESFVASIQQHGILVPLTVAPNGDGYNLLAGERRYTGALLAGLKEVPVLVRENASDTPDAEELVVALIENIKREDLTIVEEARAAGRLRELGYTSRKMIAAKLNVPQKRVKQYEQINVLPDDVQELLHTGKLSVGTLDTLESIATASPELCSIVANTLVSQAGRWTIESFATSWPRLIPDGSRRTEDGDYEQVEKPRFFSTGNRYLPEAFELSEENKALAEEITSKLDYSEYSIRFDESDIDAATAYGCCIQVGADDAFTTYHVITDAEWVNDRVNSVIIPRDKQGIDHPTLQTTSTKKPTIEAEAEKRGVEVDVIKEERKAEREEEYEARQESDAYNIELGRQLFERLSTQPVTNEALDLLIGLALRDGAVSLFMRGLRYVHPAYREDDTLKNGKVKTTFAGNEEARETIQRFLADGVKTPEEKLGRFMQLWIAAQFADDRVVARTKRVGLDIYPGRDAVHGCPEMLERGTQKALKALTPKLRKTATDRKDELDQERRGH